MAQRIRRLLLSGVIAGAALAAPAAGAGVFRAYLSVNGSDANPCTVASPCRLLPAALAVVNPGGEVWMLDSANFNTAPVAITKSVTILAVPGALGSVVANGGDALVVNGAAAKVSLRNLVLIHLANGANGISFLQGALLELDGCEVSNMPGTGLSVVAPGSAVTVRNASFRDNAHYGISVASTATATIDASLVSRNGDGGVSASSGAKVTVSNSVVANHAATGASAGIVASSASGATTQVVVERSVLRANGYAVSGQGSGAGDTVQLTIARNAISHNGVGYGASAVGGATVSAVIDDNTITHNATGVVVGAGVVETRQNNTFLFNGVNVNGSLGAVGAM
jgi:hypothetical protein